MNRLSAARRGYDHRWRIRSKHFLQRNPLCVMCEAEGKLTVAMWSTMLSRIKVTRCCSTTCAIGSHYAKRITTAPSSASTCMATALRLTQAQAYTETLSIRAMRDERAAGKLAVARGGGRVAQKDEAYRPVGASFFNQPPLS